GELATQHLSRAQLLYHAQRRPRPLRHETRASDDPSADQIDDGKCRAGKHTFFQFRALLVRGRAENLNQTPDTLTRLGRNSRTKRILMPGNLPGDRQTVAIV